MAQKYVGIDLGSDRVKFAVMTAGFRGTQLLDVFEQPVGVPPARAEGEGDPDPVSHAVGVTLQTLRARGLLSQTLGLCLPPGLLSYRVLSFPFADERRISQAVAFEAEGQFPVPIEQLVHGHAVVPAANGAGGRALVVAGKRKRLEQIVDVFKRSGADLKVVTSGAVAQAQVARIEVPSAVAGAADPGLHPVALLVDIGHQFTHCVAVGAKGPVAVRTLRRGSRHVTDAIAAAYQLPYEEAELAKRRDAFLPHRGFDQISPEQMKSGELVARSVEPILREIEHTRLWLRATYHLEVGKLVLAGGGSELTGLDAYLVEQTGLPVEPLVVGAPGLRTDVANLRPFATAIGAAYGAARRPLIQLYDVEQTDSAGAWVQERLSGLIAIGIAVMAFGALDTIARVRAGEAELLAREAELSEATREAFGKALTPVEVDAKLAEVEGSDLTSLLPDRGALEVLAMITKAATPSDLSTAPPPVAPTTMVVPPPLGIDVADLGDDPLEVPVPGSVAPPTGPIPKDAGIVVSDDLVLEFVDIRERKVEIKASALTSSAQDRLGLKLAGLGCISNVSRGKVKGDERKQFEMTMDNNCYHKQETVDDAAAAGGGGEGEED